MPFERIALWLFTLNLGVVFGAGVYEARISFARWLGPSHAAPLGWHAEEARRDDVGRRFWGLTTTVPLTLLVLVNTFFAFTIRSAAPASAHVPLVLACGAGFIDRALTFGYFIPKMVKLLAAEDSEEARARAKEWGMLNYVRLACVAVGWVAATQALVG